MKSVVVSTRIRRADKDTLKEAGVDLAAESRTHLEQIAASIRARKSLERLDKMIDRLMPPAKLGYARRSIREDRERN